MSGKKIVLKLNLHGEKAKQKALQAVAGVEGVDSLSMDMEDQKLTVIGEVDPVELVAKLKKWYREIVTVGDAMEPQNENETTTTTEEENIPELGAYNPWLTQQHNYHHRHVVVCCEENPNICVIQ